MATLESRFQSRLIRKIKQRFPGSMVLKLDATHIQGIPDLLVLWCDRWATLECKRSARAHVQPNQAHYVRKMDEMSFSRFIFPENEEDVLNELETTFRAGRDACLPLRK